jgi:DNA repair photolyase
MGAFTATLVRPLFEDWLARHFPERKEKVLNRIRSMRGGKLNDARFGSRMRGEGIFADRISQLFEISCRRAGLEGKHFPRLSTTAFLRPREMQPPLFDCLKVPSYVSDNSRKVGPLQSSRE